jgi:hypothetical protein
MVLELPLAVERDTVVMPKRTSSARTGRAFILWIGVFERGEVLMRGENAELH